MAKEKPNPTTLNDDVVELQVYPSDDAYTVICRICAAAAAALMKHCHLRDAVASERAMGVAGMALLFSPRWRDCIAALSTGPTDFARYHFEMGARALVFQNQLHELLEDAGLRIALYGEKNEELRAALANMARVDTQAMHRIAITETPRR